MNNEGKRPPQDLYYGASTVRRDGVFCPGMEHATGFYSDLELGEHPLDRFARDVRAQILGIVDSEDPLDEVLARERLADTGADLFGMAAVAAMRLSEGEDGRVCLTALASNGLLGCAGDWPREAEVYVIRLIGGNGIVRFVVNAAGPQFTDWTRWRFQFTGRVLTEVIDLDRSPGREVA